VLNVTGWPAVPVRELAQALGRRLRTTPTFAGQEADTALLSDARRMQALFGPPDVSLDEMVDHVASWVQAGGRSLGKPTHFESREGRF
jgi:hypothetical protein